MRLLAPSIKPISDQARKAVSVYKASKTKAAHKAYVDKKLVAERHLRSTSDDVDRAAYSCACKRIDIVEAEVLAKARSRLQDTLQKLIAKASEDDLETINRIIKTWIGPT